MSTRIVGIKHSVGRSGTNSSSDVKVIQKLLNGALRRKGPFKDAALQPLAEDGNCTPETISALEKFQQVVLRWSGPAVDGTVSPHRATWKALIGNVPSFSRVKPLAVPRPPKVDGFSTFRQGEYSSVTLGSGKLSISGYGCALCTLTMAATAIGAPSNHWPPDLLPQNLTPPIVNDILSCAGAFSGSLLNIGRAAEALGMTYDEFGMRPGAWSDLLGPDDVQLIESHLTSGNPVAANVDYKETDRGDHWILVTRRFGDGTFGSIDPATGRALVLTRSPPPASTVGRELAGGVLFGWGQGGSSNQQKYVVKRFGLLAPGSGGLCAPL